MHYPKEPDCKYYFYERTPQYRWNPKTGYNDFLGYNVQQMYSDSLLKVAQYIFHAEGKHPLWNSRINYFWSVVQNWSQKCYYSDISYKSFNFRDISRGRQPGEGKFILGNFTIGDLIQAVDNSPDVKPKRVNSPYYGWARRKNGGHRAGRDRINISAQKRLACSEYQEPGWCDHPDCLTCDIASSNWLVSLSCYSSEISFKVRHKANEFKYNAWGDPKKGQRTNWKHNRKTQYKLEDTYV